MQTRQRRESGRPPTTFSGGPQRSGQAEVGEDAVVESGQGADPSSRQGEDEQPVAVGDRRVVVSHVQAEGGLSVGPGGHQLVAPSCLEDHRRMEVSDQLPAVVLERDRRHGEPNVPCQQGDDAGHVACHEGVGEALDQDLLGRRPREGGRFTLTGRLEAAIQGGPGALRALLTESSVDSSMLATSAVW